MYMVLVTCGDMFWFGSNWLVEGLIWLEMCALEGPKMCMVNPEHSCELRYREYGSKSDL